jgi:glyoxylase-like metal-dependent hydrolase (beta-lactamase superfamily II)
MTEYQMELPDPKVDIAGAVEVAPGIIVIPDRDLELVPNIGLISGANAVLVVDTGIGIENGQALLDYVRAVAASRRIYLTTTHFHPEHTFGAQVFAEHAHYLINSSQSEDLRNRGSRYLEMFKGISKTAEDRLQGVTVVNGDEIYHAQRELDLGGLVVELLPVGGGHTSGDQVIHVPSVGVLFMGDLAETDRFPLLPYFPPVDVDPSPSTWVRVLDQLIGLDPRVVVPGHGAVGDARLLYTVRDVILELQSATRNGVAGGLGADALADQVSSVLLAQYPDWRGAQWIPAGVAAVLAEDQTNAA